MHIDRRVDLKRSVRRAMAALGPGRCFRPFAGCPGYTSSSCLKNFRVASLWDWFDELLTLHWSHDHQARDSR